MPAPVPLTSFVTLISTTVAPVVLVSSSAILLGAVSARYNALASQVRSLTAEYRLTALDQQRKNDVRLQLDLFDKRINAVWISSVLLSVSIVLFLASMVELFFESHRTAINSNASWPILGGLVCMTLALVADLVEIAVGRRTLLIERGSCRDAAED